MDSERWLPVVGYEGAYEVSDQGNVKSVDRVVQRKDGTTMHVAERLLRKKFTNNGARYAVTLSLHAVETSYRVSHLVAAAFIGPRPPGNDVRHLDDNGTDDRLVNLAYGTKSENRWDCVRNGHHHYGAASHCIRGHAFSGPNLRVQVKAGGNEHRTCRACNMARDRLRKHPYLDLQETADAYYAQIMGDVAA